MRAPTRIHRDPTVLHDWSGQTNASRRALSRYLNSLSVNWIVHNLESDRERRENKFLATVKVTNFFDKKNVYNCLIDSDFIHAMRSYMLRSIRPDSKLVVQNPTVFAAFKRDIDHGNTCNDVNCSVVACQEVRHMVGCKNPYCKVRYLVKFIGYALKRGMLRITTDKEGRTRLLSRE